jgi:site-specific DNA recombinase
MTPPTHDVMARQRSGEPSPIRGSFGNRSKRSDGLDAAEVDRQIAELLKLLIRACRFNAALVNSGGVSFAALAKREGVSPSYFTRLVRLSYLAPDITQAILDGRQPRDLTADKLLAHSRLPLTWHEQRKVLGFA